MLLVLFVALVALAGVVIDGGAKLNQAENANAIAQEAARAGAGLVKSGRNRLLNRVIHGGPGPGPGRGAGEYLAGARATTALVTPDKERSRST